jgi:hypothetical protein
MAVPCGLKPEATAVHSIPTEALWSPLSDCSHTKMNETESLTSRASSYLPRSPKLKESAHPRKATYTFVEH